MAHHLFDAPITLEGPERHPRQMLAEQTYGAHASLHDEGTAGSLGLPGAPIEGSTRGPSSTGRYPIQRTGLPSPSPSTVRFW
jgi:hypothetical protein